MVRGLEATIRKRKEAGGKNSQQKSIFTDFTSWSDCTEWKFTNWSIHKWWGQQPYNNGNEDCLQMGGWDRWYDVACRFKKKYVCSRTLCALLDLSFVKSEL